MASNTGRGVGTVARPLGRAAKRAISDLSTLSSERGAVGYRVTINSYYHITPFHT